MSAPVDTMHAIPPLTRTGDAYDVAQPPPPGQPGDLIAATDPRPASTSLIGAQRSDILYHSINQAGEDTAVSGVVLVPSGPAPPQGWPVVSWAHGTTGVADACAPSLTENLFYNEYAQVARTFLSHGYAVVATDYVGLATAGLHGYSLGDELGNAVVDMVAAARLAVGNLSNRWFGVGHSEGGQAVIFASRAAKRHPELTLMGTVAIAPSSWFQAALPAIAAGELPADVAYGMYLLAGLSRLDDSLDPASLVAPSLQSLAVAAIEHDCLPDSLKALATTQPDEVFRIEPTKLTQLSDVLFRAAEPDQSPSVGPLLVLHGELDHDIPIQASRDLVETLKSFGASVEFREYPGLNHDEVLGPSLCDTLRWMAQHDGVAVDRCTPEATDLS